MIRNVIVVLLAAAFCSACSSSLVEYEANDLKIQVHAGEEWKHPFPLALGIKQKNPPQIAVWIEDMNGQYLATVYASHKYATRSWQGKGVVDRKEALPYHLHKSKSRADGVSGATPLGSFDIKLTPDASLTKFVLMAEFNHSTDFNDYYAKYLAEGVEGYSGGKEGSGQPAVVYAAVVDLTSGKTSFEATLIGHSSPDGSDGLLYTDLSKLTTAMHIVEKLTVTIK